MLFIFKDLKRAAAIYKNYLKIAVVGFVILVAEIVQLHQIKYLSPNYDELKYLAAAQSLARDLSWNSVDERLHPPLMYYIADSLSKFAPVNEINVQLFWARFPFMLLLPLFGVTVFLTVRSMYGFLSGFIALVLFMFNPEILAHSRFISPDFISTFGFLVSVFLFTRFISKQTLLLSIIFGLVLGLTLLTKYTTLILLPFFTIFTPFFAQRKQLLKSFGLLTIAFLIAVLIVNAGYFFSGSLEIPKDFESGILSGLSNTPLSSIFHLFPRPFLLGLDFQFVTSSKGWWGWFWGTQYIKAPWYVLPATFVIKTPVSLLIFIVLAMILSIKKEFIKSKAEIIFLLFIIVFTWYMSFINHIAIGLRYLLPIYPFLFILVSKLVIYKPRSVVSQGTFNLFLIFIMSWYVFKTIAVSPHFLEYTNEIFGGPSNAYKYFVDSSLDWGQNNFYLESYRRSHPNSIIEPQWPAGGTIVTGPTTGTIVVGVNDFNLWKAGTFEWLRRIYKKPSGSVGYTWLIFNVTPEDLERL